LRAQSYDVAGVLRHVERHAHMRLRPEVVDLVRLEVVEQLHHLHRVGEVAVVEKQLHAIDVRVLVKVVDATGVERRGAAHDAVDLVPLRKEQLCQI